MTTVSSLLSASRLSNTPLQNVGMPSVLPSKLEVQGPPIPQQSAIVTVSAGNLQSVDEPTYSMPVIAPMPPVWKNQSDDKVSSLMAGNFLSHSLTSRLKGLGSALLDILKSGGSDFSQLVIQPAGVNKSGASSYPQADEQLLIKTKSGVEVHISLKSQDSGLAVEMESSGELSDAERSALEKLSGAFQDALDGLAAVPPHLDLDGLTQFDPTVLSSVDLHSSVTLDDQTTQLMDFHADSATRNLSWEGPAGTVKVNVDMSDFSNWGSSRQRAGAIDNYLKQFDQAASRGKADASLMTMFKDAFTQMNSDYDPQSLQGPAAMLADSDYAMLTGLADFNASVTQTAKASNPKHPDELDTFSYQASQSTSIRETGQLDRSISQQQHSHLSASYHMQLAPDLPLNLTMLESSQNYYYQQIDDTADSSTDIEYKGGRLIKVLSNQSASQSTHVLKYEMGNLTADTTTPFNASTTRDILATIKPLEEEKSRSPLDAYRWEKALSDVHGRIFLQPNPGELHDESSWP